MDIKIRKSAYTACLLTLLVFVCLLLTLAITVRQNLPMCLWTITVEYSSGKVLTSNIILPEDVRYEKDGMDIWFSSSGKSIWGIESLLDRYNGTVYDVVRVVRLEKIRTIPEEDSLHVDKMKQ